LKVNKVKKTIANFKQFKNIIGTYLKSYCKKAI
jgi:hypothetical protein